MWLATGMGGAARGDTQQIVNASIIAGGKLIVMCLANSHEIIGSSWITNDSRRLYLHHFGILPEYQGLGLSKHLLKESLAFAKEKQMQIKLEVHNENTLAIELYKKIGFTFLGDYDVYIIRDIESINL